MDDLLLVAETQNRTNLYLSELSAFTLKENGIEGDPGALYLYEEVLDGIRAGIRVLAQVPDVSAAYRIIDLLGHDHSTA